MIDRQVFFLLLPSPQASRLKGWVDGYVGGMGDKKGFFARRRKRKMCRENQTSVLPCNVTTKPHVCLSLLRRSRKNIENPSISITQLLFLLASNLFFSLISKHSRIPSHFDQLVLQRCVRMYMQPRLTKFKITRSPVTLAKRVRSFKNCVLRSVE